MNAPLIYIGMPLAAAFVLWLFRESRLAAAYGAAGFSLLMMILTLTLRIDSFMNFGKWVFEISPTFFILGRKFVILDTDRTFLAFIFLFGVFWFFGVVVTETSRYFVPIALAIMAILIAALAVEPFLYAALLVEIAVLLSIPMLATQGEGVGQGVKRFMIYQTLAVPFMLFAGWVSGGVEANPADEKLLSQAVLFLGLGFAFWLAVFPFYTWVPFLSSEANPYVAGYILGLLPIIVLLLGLDFLNTYAWLREYPPLLPALRTIGIIMVVTGGVLSAFQTNLGRLFGYAVIMGNGFAILALSLGTSVGYEILVMSFLPRMVGLGVYSLSLTLFTRAGLFLSFDGLRGSLSRFPFVGSSLMVAYFSLAGFPLLASFPVRLTLIDWLALESLAVSGWVIIGGLGFLLGGFRSLAVLAGGEQSLWSIGESMPQAIILSAGIIMLLLMGLFPNWFLPHMKGLLDAFSYLQ